MFTCLCSDVGKWPLKRRWVSLLSDYCAVPAHSEPVSFSLGLCKLTRKIQVFKQIITHMKYLLNMD